ncbi:hypothetical protein PoB_005382100 [Plakobranchus ocellatus]|uniref:Uncharacterized protein n=1 Tax=Plakobranchus ocellatus TaxID=259542 RepID=A0AAV4C7J9_9GAST|nr:hypothetical protein PoB_005382100 [Plakobranchus ocellatus]
MSRTRLTQGFGGEINGTSKSTLDLPRDVDLPLDGSPSGHRSASGRRVCLWTQGLPLDVGLPLGVGLYPAVQDSTTTGRLLWLAYAQPKIYVFRKSSYFTCAEDYQVLGVDYTLLELDVSKSNSLYSYEKDRGPRFEYKTRDNGKLSKPMHFCTPFTDRQKGFCVTKQSFPNGCSCEKVGVDRFRLKANFTVTAKEMSNGILSLTWPDKRGVLRYDYNLPEVKTRPTREEKPEGKTAGLRIVHILAAVQGAGLLTTGGYLYFCIRGNENVYKLEKAALNRVSCSGKLICWSDLKPQVNYYIHTV